MQHLDLAALRYFQETAQCGSIRQASDRLHVTPSAVSRQIAKLEARLDAPLFERHAGGMKLTAAGQLLANELSSIYRNLGVVQARIAEIQQLGGGSVAIYCMEGAIDSWLPSVVSQFNAMHPRVEFVLNVASSDRCMAALVEGACDIAIMFHAPARREIRVVARAQTPLMAVLAPDHPLASHRRVSFAQLFQYPLALPDATFGVRQLLDAHVRKTYGQPLAVAFTTNSVAMARALAREHQAVTVLPQFSVLLDCARQSLVALPVQASTPLQAQVQLCLRRGRESGLAVQAVLAAMRDRFAEFHMVP